MVKPEKNSVETLYSKPNEGGILLGNNPTDDSVKTEATGTSPSYLSEYYEKRKQFWAVMKWFLPILLGIVATVGIGLYIYYLQSINGPINQLEVRTDINTKSIEQLMKKVYP